MAAAAAAKKKRLRVTSQAVVGAVLVLDEQLLPEDLLLTRPFVFPRLL